MKKGDTIQGRTLYKGGHYLRKYGRSGLRLMLVLNRRENVSLLLKIIFSSPQIQLSDVNKAYINIGDGQKSEL